MDNSQISPISKNIKSTIWILSFINTIKGKKSLNKIFSGHPSQSRFAACHGMILLAAAVGSTVAALVGIAFARKNIGFIMNWAILQLKYNHIAMKNIAQDFLQAKKNKTDCPQMPGRVAIVTGGSRGIGAEVVRMLLQCDMEVIIACRRPEAGQKAIKEIREAGVKTGKPRVMELDNCSLESVRKFVQEFENNYEKLDILINNAGIMFTPYRETKEGFEEQYGVNYLSHFYLSLLLIPKLKKGGNHIFSSRIINVSSCAHLLGKINFDDINCQKNFLTGEAYAQSKLAQLLFTKSLARYLKEKKLPIITHAVHPGVVNTDLFDHSYLKHLRPIGRLLFKNPVQGATPIVFTAVSPTLEEKSGLYISNCLETPVNPLADDVSLQDRLFNFSLQQVKLESVPE